MQPEHALTLPEPDAASAAHSARCADYIHERIRDAGGSISFAEFMHYTLYAPGLGYYTAGARKFGAEGDFITAPEISTLFGKVLARQCAGVLESIREAAILEFGAGTGKLAADVLAALAEMDALPAEYRIFEISPDLRERQQAFLQASVPSLAERVTWLDRLPKSHAGVIVANEVLDALPVERFQRDERGVQQLRVVSKGSGFSYVGERAPDVLRRAVEDIEADIGAQLPAGYVSDVCLAARAWIADLAGCLDHGIALLFDYGTNRREYYRIDRRDGWLRCHFRHRAHNDALIHPGIQDLTAWVDFSAVASAAVESGLAIEGYTDQAHFLLGGGLDREARQIAELPLESQLEMSGEIRMLTLPGEMGENIKCIGLSRDCAIRPDAFAAADRTHTL